MADPMQPYSVALIDPPWHYNKRHLVRRDGRRARAGYGAVNHYPVMKTVDIARVVPLQRILAPDALIFMWCTAPNDREKYVLADLWGLKYITKAFCWVKTTRKSGEPFFGIGHYSASNTEDCWLFRRGRPRFIRSLGASQIIEAPSDPPSDPDLSEVWCDTCGMIVAPRGVHSAKPSQVRDAIDRLVDGPAATYPRIEIFYRGVPPGNGWHVWGNQVRHTTSSEPVLAGAHVPAMEPVVP